MVACFTPLASVSDDVRKCRFVVWVSLPQTNLGLGIGGGQQFAAPEALASNCLRHGAAVGEDFWVERALHDLALAVRRIQFQGLLKAGFRIFTPFPPAGPATETPPTRVLPSMDQYRAK